MKSVSLKEDGNVFSGKKQNRKFFDASSESIYPAEIYHGYINCGVFADTDVEITGQKKLYLTVEVQVERWADSNKRDSI